MPENEDTTTEDFDAAETESTSGLTHEQALKELSKVRREAAKHRTEKQATKASLEELQRYKDAEKTELEKVTEKATAAEAELTELRREKAARAAAKTAGLDSEWVDLVKGSTEDELLASAKELAERLGKTKAAPAGFNSAGGKPVKADNDNSSEAFRNFLLNR